MKPLLVDLYSPAFIVKHRREQYWSQPGAKFWLYAHFFGVLGPALAFGLMLTLVLVSFAYMRLHYDLGMFADTIFVTVLACVLSIAAFYATDARLRRVHVWQQSMINELGIYYDFQGRRHQAPEFVVERMALLRELDKEMSFSLEYFMEDPIVWAYSPKSNRRVAVLIYDEHNKIIHEH